MSKMTADNKFEVIWNKFEHFCEDNELTIKEMFKLDYVIMQQNVLEDLMKRWEDPEEEEV